jgi:hypothetical protein
MKQIVISLFVIFLVIGCVNLPSSPPNQSECGAYPTGCETIIEKTVRDSLKDPESARFQFEPTPYIGWRSVHSKPVACYIVKVWVNAKNGFGGYTGKQPYWFAIRDGVIIGEATLITVPESDWSNHTPTWWEWN